MFTNGQLLLHSGGHYVPATKEVRKVCIEFIEQFVNK